MPNVSSVICQHHEVHKEVAKQLSLKEKATTSQFVKVLMDRKAAFEEKLSALIKEKGQNAAIFPTTQRDQMITDILRSAC
ncbi:hypothetical protein T11_13828 [Trichinella zimbabwensis]|uniref:Uncharacterized protein n=1 Tax=Trichinella zimbabwensis TaxID=268475 RepID=A0A0V1GUR8_9BILA|nr:hypothetical protein T11_13828 [Trichinella zimbabwensis]